MGGTGSFLCILAFEDIRSRRSTLSLYVRVIARRERGWVVLSEIEEDFERGPVRACIPIDAPAGVLIDLKLSRH